MESPFRTKIFRTKFEFAAQDAVLPSLFRVLIYFFAKTMHTYLSTIVLLILSNLFMTYAWYGHLKNMNGKPLFVIILVSWGIALFEYTLQVPANRIGIHAMTLPQLKILQEAISLSVFVPFAVFYMRSELSWNYLWACCCIMGAVYFIFKN